MAQRTYTGSDFAKDILLDIIPANTTELYARTNANATELTNARGSEATLKDRIDAVEMTSTDMFTEVIAARGGAASLKDRLDLIFTILVNTEIAFEMIQQNTFAVMNTQASIAYPNRTVQQTIETDTYSIVWEGVFNPTVFKQITVTFTGLAAPSTTLKAEIYIDAAAWSLQKPMNTGSSLVFTYDGIGGNANSMVKFGIRNTTGAAVEADFDYQITIAKV